LPLLLAAPANRATLVASTIPRFDSLDGALLLIMFTCAMQQHSVATLGSGSGAMQGDVPVADGHGFSIM